MVLMFLLVFKILLLLVVWVLQRDGKLDARAWLGWLLEARDDGVCKKACITVYTGILPQTGVPKRDRAV
jgi:hypothetical protein